MSILINKIKTWVYTEPKRVLSSFGYFATLLGLVLAAAGLLYALGVTPSYLRVKLFPPPPKKYRILVPLDANGIEYLAYMQKDVKKNGNATYDLKYSNRASQNIRSILKAALDQWSRDNHSPSLDIDFYCFPEGWSFDKDSYKQAFDQAITASETAGRDVVAVLGNVSSSATMKYGILCAEKKLPMILPLATATNLTHNLRVMNVPAVLRLPPANDMQAKAIADFLAKSNIHQAVLVKDLSNDAYSTDLVEGFRASYVDKLLSSIDRGATKQFGQILGVVPVGGPETGPFFYSNFSSAQEKTALVIIGMTNSSLETLSQVRASKAKYEYTILTDGAVDENLAARIVDVRGADRLSNLYLAFPSPCVIPEALEQYADLVRANKQDLEMSHTLYAADGAYIILTLLNSGLLKDSDKAGNQILIDAITKVKAEADDKETKWLAENPGKVLSAPLSQTIDVTLPFAGDVKREYKFDKFGNNVNAGYTLYRIAITKSRGQATVNWEMADGSTPSPLKCGGTQQPQPEPGKKGLTRKHTRRNKK